MSNYPSDLSDQQWDAVRPCIPPSPPVGLGRQVSLRDVVNAIRYRQRSGCAWRLLPHDFPHWRTVYGYHQQWQSDGTWRQVEQTLRRARPRTPAVVLSDASPVDGLSVPSPSATNSL